MFENSLLDWFRQSLTNCWSLFVGLLTACLGYILPVKNIVHLVLFFFLLDIVFGYWAARKLRNEKFSTKIIWNTTMPRTLLSIVLIICSFLWDEVFQQNMVDTYRVIGWFICGVLIYSIAKNGYKITHWEMFPLIGYLMANKIKKETGVDIEVDIEIKKGEAK